MAFEAIAALDEAPGPALAVAAEGEPPDNGRSAASEDDELLPAWRRYAAARPDIDGRPMIVLIVDDLGIDSARVERAIALDESVTLAFLPYAAGIERSAWLARRARHEILVHLPMEPMSADADPGPNALFAGLERDELIRLLYWNLSRFGEFVGVNNHMGSRLTTDWEAMTILLLELHARGLLYLDSVTTPTTVGPDVARDLGMPALRRDIFIDADRSPAAIDAALAELEAIAHQSGAAIGIAHPYDESFDALERWLPGLESEGLVLVPLSTVAEHLANEAPGS